MTTKKEMFPSLQGSVIASKKVDRNTLEVVTGEKKQILLYDTPIVTCLKDGTVILDSGGWRSNLTKNRINRFSPYKVWQEKHLWYVAMNGTPRTKEDKTLFFDGIKIKNGRVLNQKSEEEATKMMKKINKYVKNITPDNIPKPNDKDCWVCLGLIRAGDTEHLVVHIEEARLPGTLLVQAMRHAGYSDLQIAAHYMYCSHDVFRRALKKYLISKLMY